MKIRRHIVLLFIIVVYASCQKQKSQEFGSKGIDHLELATTFVDQLQSGQFERCYEQLNEKYKTGISLEDFRNRARFIENLGSDDPLVHFQTDYIGKISEIGQRKYSGEVTKDMMPEFLFTPKSMMNNEFKEVKLFLRFESEDSDKINVLDYARDIPIHNNDCTSGCFKYDNPFFSDKFLLVVQTEDSLFFDMNGDRGREIKKRLNKVDNGKLLQAITTREVADILKSVAGQGFTFFLVIRESDDNYDKINEFFQMVRDIGDRQFKQKLDRVKDVDQFILNYEAYDPFPTYSKLVDP